MAKRAIYLDERERDLARRAFEVLRGYLVFTIKIHTRRLEVMALQWTHDELEALAAKFEEPSSDEQPA